MESMWEVTTLAGCKLGMRRGIFIAIHPDNQLPCRRYDFLANLYTYPAQTCIIAYSTVYDYDTVSAPDLALHVPNDVADTALHHQGACSAPLLGLW
jgi:hypothetical protein